MAVTGEEQGKGNFGKIEDNQIKGDIRIENHKTGATVRITSVQPLSKLAFWSTNITLCPEPYIAIKVNPGEQFKWNFFYEFYTCEKSN